MAIIINFNKTTSENDMDDLKILLEDIRARFHFSWFVQGSQENNQSPEIKSADKSNVSLRALKTNSLSLPTTEQTQDTHSELNTEILNDYKIPKKITKVNKNE